MYTFMKSFFIIILSGNTFAVNDFEEKSVKILQKKTRFASENT